MIQLSRTGRGWTWALGLAVLGAGCGQDPQVLVWDFPIEESQVKNGPESDGSTNSPGRGHGRIEFDPATNTFLVRIRFEGLIGDLSQLHIHGPARADTSTPRHVIELLGPPEVPEILAATQGLFETRVPLAATQQTDQPPLLREAVLPLLQDGHTYLNVHTTVFGMGEIRGNLGFPQKGTSRLSEIDTP